MAKFNPVRGNYMPEVAFTMRFTTHMDARLKALSKKYDLSRAALILQCLDFALDNMTEESPKS